MCSRVLVNLTDRLSQDHRTRHAARAFSMAEHAVPNPAARAEASVAQTALVADMLVALHSCQEQDEGATSFRRLAFCPKVRSMCPVLCFYSAQSPRHRPPLMTM